MKLLLRIFLSNLLVFAVGLYLLVSWIGDDLKPEYRKATEEPLVDSARILASMVAASSQNGNIDVSVLEGAFRDVYDQRFTAEIFGHLKRDVDYRVYVTDAEGTVLFHSSDRSMVGEDFSLWRDVILTLRGEYGARTSQDDPDDPTTNVMYIAAPIIMDGEIAGVLTVGKPTRTGNLFVMKTKRTIQWGAVVVGIAVLLASLVLSGMITRPVKKLTVYARAVRDGRRVSLPRLGSGEIGELGNAFEEMRDALEGKQYVEHYVQTLTHEVKSPLAAIRGAVELLKEDMTAEQREKFLTNIENEAERVQAVVEKLLLLASLESKKAITEVEELDLTAIVDDVLVSFRPLLEGKGLTVQMNKKDSSLFQGDRFLVRHAVANLLMNAVEFSPKGQELELSVEASGASGDGKVSFSVRDHGPGVPDYALERVHERFYSLRRPDTGRKSSGLGLALVREVAELHGGSSKISNSPDGGVEAVLILPTEHRVSTA